MIALIDGDILVYTSSFSVQYKEYSHPEVGSSRRRRDLAAVVTWNFEDDEGEDIMNNLTCYDVLEDKASAEYNFDSMMQRIIQETNATEYKLFLSGDNNFRKEVDYPVKYKGGRPDKPVYYQDMMQYARSKWGAISMDNLEADDLLGIYSGPDTIICSIDKDLQQIPGLHYHLDKKEITTVTPEDGRRYFWEQMLMGDRVDNIIGLNKVGPVGAKKLLAAANTEEEFSDIVWKLYEKEFGIDATRMFRSNKLLLEICTEYNEDKFSQGKRPQPTEVDSLQVA